MKPSLRRSLGLAALLTGLTVGAYWPALGGGFLWDDDAHVQNCPQLRSGPGLTEIWLQPGATVQYYPLTFTLWWLGYHLWGLTIWPYHLLNVLLHAAAAVLLWRVLRALAAPGAFLAGLIFALHPVHVMSVAWITELKNVLSGTLFLGALWAYLRFAGLGMQGAGPAAPADLPADDQKIAGPARPTQTAQTDRRRWWFYALALALFALALFAKTAASLLVAALVLVLWWRRGRLGWRDLWPLGPFALAALALGRVTLAVERLHGATGPEFALTVPQKLLVAGRAFWFYLGKLAWPHPLMFIYERWRIDPARGWQWLYPAAFLALVLGLWLARRRIGRAPLAAVLYFFCGTAGLVFLLVLYMTRYTWVSDHWQYLGSMGVIACAAAGLARGARRLHLGHGWRAAALAAVLAGALGLLTWQRGHVYQNRGALWADTVARNPRCAMARGHLGDWLAEQGDEAAAGAQYRAALDLDPTMPGVWSRLGNLLLRRQQDAAAQDCLERALALDPSLPVAHCNLAFLLRRQGRTEAARAHLETACALDPTDPAAPYNLGDLHLQAGRLPEAIAALERAAALDPPHAAPALAELGAALHQAGRTDAAIARLRQAVALAPRDPALHSNLGLFLAAAGRDAEALAELRAALPVDPTLAPAWAQLTQALLGRGETQRACAYATQLVQAVPDDLPAHLLLADACARADRFAQAIRSADAALALAQRQGDAARADQIRRRLEIYSAGKVPPTP